MINVESTGRGARLGNTLQQGIGAGNTLGASIAPSGFASNMPSRAERKRARASTGRTKSSKHSAYAATVRTAPETIGADTEMLSCRTDLSIDNVHEKVDTPAHHEFLAAVSRSRNAHVKASR